MWVSVILAAFSSPSGDPVFPPFSRAWKERKIPLLLLLPCLERNFRRLFLSSSAHAQAWKKQDQTLFKSDLLGDAGLQEK